MNINIDDFQAAPIKELNKIKPLETSDLFGDIKRLTNEMPSLMLASRAKVGNIQLRYTNRIQAAIEWIENAGIRVDSIFVDNDSFEQMVDEFTFAHPGSYIEGDVNCVVLPRKDQKGEYSIFKSEPEKKKIK